MIDDGRTLGVPVVRPVGGRIRADRCERDSERFLRTSDFAAEAHQHVGRGQKHQKRLSEASPTFGGNRRFDTAFHGPEIASFDQVRHPERPRCGWGLAGDTQVVELTRALGRVGERTAAEVSRKMATYFHARSH